MAYTNGPNGIRRPRDVIGNAVHCARMLVGEAEEQYADDLDGPKLTRVLSEEERKAAERTTPSSYEGDNAAG